MRRIIPFFLAVMLLGLGLSALANDGTRDGACANTGERDFSFGSLYQPTDDVYVLTPFESVSISATSTWTDNRHRAYYSGSNVNGFLLFDVTNIPDNSLIVSMNLLCHLENAFGSPSSNPVVDIYWSDDDNWTRNSVQPNQLSLDDILIDNVPFTTYVPTYNFTLNVAGHDWSVDLQDNQICLGFKNDVTYYSYVYFYGAYGAPTGPAPELTIVTSTGTPQDVNITLTPANPPIVIPANGGSFDYDVAIMNDDPATASFNAWIMAELPDSSVIGPLIIRTVTLGAGASIERAMSQYVPGYAPSGEYTYSAYVGIYPDNVWDSDSFNFTKSATSDGSTPEIIGWTLQGWDDNPAPTLLPTESVMLSANPNPFNPYTNIVFNLPQEGEIQLAVYDVTGREVEVLAQGWFKAGNQQFRFNGSQHASGIYFARLMTQGKAYTHKILLLK